MRLLFLAPALLLACMGCASSDAYPRRPNAQEIADVEGIYGLSDGFRAHVYGQDNNLYVRIGAGPEKRLMMVGPDRFRTERGDVDMQFQPIPDDDVNHRVLVAYYRKPWARPPIMFSSGLRPGRGFVD